MTGKFYSERQLIAANQSIEEKSFWLTQLADTPEKACFPYDYRGADSHRRDFKVLTFKFCGQIFYGLMKLSNSSDVRLHIILVTLVMILLNKYVKQKDLMVGTPIYKQDIQGEFVNTVLPLRSRLEGDRTFKELLLQVSQAVLAASEHQNYPLETLLFQLDIPFSPGHDFPLFDVVVLLANIQDNKDSQNIHHNIDFSFRREEEEIQGTLTYNSLLYRRESIEKMAEHIETLTRSVLADINVRLDEISILSEKEKQRILYGFNKTGARYPKDKTVIQLFEEQVERTPAKTAVSFPINLTDVYEGLAAEKIGFELLGKFEKCCFRQSSYIFRAGIDRHGWIILKSHRHNCVVVNRHVSRLLHLLDGTKNLKTIFRQLEPVNVHLAMFTMKETDLLEITCTFHDKPGIFSTRTFADLVRFIKVLYDNHLIELVAVAPQPYRIDRLERADFDEPGTFDNDFDLNARLHRSRYETLSRADVLLLGDTPGMSSTGLLYLAAYLMRNGIKAYCQFYDAAGNDRDLEQNLKTLIERIQPEIVAVSMKWFLYIARVLHICKLIKKISPKTRVVIGGDTASYYWREFINCEGVDYVIRGDGEVPLLRLCRGEVDVPNCVSKRNGKITTGAIGYVQDENTLRDIYLSHLDEVMLSEYASLPGTFTINTHKGCRMNCLYCGGCLPAQRKTFGRDRVVRRGIEEVRKDIKAALKYASTFHFDFEAPDRDLLDYCRRIWADIDLSNHFCVFNSLILPSPRLVGFVCRTFKYVYWDIDILTLSERHRQQIFEYGLVKPQPSDKEIFAFLGNCDEYNNAEVRLNLITGLPYLRIEDIAISEKTLTHIMNEYPCFSELHWARLHAQPGAPVVEKAAAYNMKSFAATFEDFLKYSQDNFNPASPYPNLENFTYPYIYFNEDELNSRVSRSYLESNVKLQQYKDAKRRDLSILEGLSYRELDRKSRRLARVLQAKGIRGDSVVGIMAAPSPEMVTGILSVLKVGGIFLPIDPESPKKRIMSMLSDSQASLLLTQNGIIEKYSYTALQAALVNRKEPHLTAPRPQIVDLDRLPFPNRSLLDYEKYNRYIGQTPAKHRLSLQATRGCPYRCAYCHKIWPKKHVVRSAENILTEIQCYYNMGMRRFAFVDDIFNLNAENSRRFFDLVISRGLDIQLFFPNGMRGDILTRDYIDLMIRAGVVNLTLALETASPRLQKLIGKNLDIEKLRRNIEYICRTYPHVILELQTMHGLPGETEDEALLTLDFIKSIQWLHFAYINILVVFPNTDMEKLALESGISPEDIEKSDRLAAHELPTTLTFDKNFTLNYQANYLNDYFLAKERLLHVLPRQMQVLTEDEIVQKYDSFLPVDINSFSDILHFAGIERDFPPDAGFIDESSVSVPHLNEKFKRHFGSPEPSQDALRILLLDLSQSFSKDSKMLYDVVEPPLGLVCIMTYLQQQFGSKIRGKIARSRIDFDNYPALKEILAAFKPDIIGIRTLTFYKDFFHKTVANIRSWGITAPIIGGGPYATSDYAAILQDKNVDLIVLGEGEVTFSQIIEAVLNNGGKFPAEKVLKKIAGIAFIPGKEYGGRQRGREIVLMDEIDDILPERPGRAPAPTERRAELSYAVYTSGSSGKPKGVLVKNSGLLNYIQWFSRQADLKTDDAALLLSSFAFDLGYTSLFSALLTGCELHVIPREIYLHAENLIDYIWKNGITYIKLTPSLFAALVNSRLFSEKRCQKLRLIVLGGEALNIADVKRAQELCGHLRIMNHYGPTEATIGAVSKFIDSQECEMPGRHSEIGTPISNTRAYIFDPGLKILPAGVPGELGLCGAGLAVGYLNRPGLTAEKFIQNPLRPGESVYRTGDLARCRPGGTFEFMGRIDNQVKIRGYRIELAEIEHQLLDHPRVDNAAVVDRQGPDGDRSLCAYLVLKGPVPGQGRQAEASSQAAAAVNRTIIRQLEDRAARQPLKVAIESAPGKIMTYDRLNRYANRVAAWVAESYDDRFQLSRQERIRYQRQMMLDGWGVESQEKLKSTTVFVAGAGGGASPVVTQLALAGFGTIIVCDFDVVELSNLNRQFLHDESRIGMNKAESAKLTIARLNPHIDIVALKEKITRQNVMELVGDAAVIFDMLDDLEGKFILSECAASKRILHVVAAMMEISSYAVLFYPPLTPCFHCLFDKTKFQELNHLRSQVREYKENPLHVLASSLFVGTGFVVTEAIKIVLGFENPAYNKFFFFNQKATPHIAETNGYKMMTYAFSDHFKSGCKSQGFDWEVGYRGNFLEELDIRKDTDCPLCGQNPGGRPLLNAQAGQRARSLTVPPVKREGEHKQVVALLLNPGEDFAAGILGILKSGKTLLLLDPDSSDERLQYVLDDSGARILISDDGHLERAVRLRDRVNRNIQVLNPGDLDKDGGESDLDLNPDFRQDADLLYSSTEAGEEAVHILTLLAKGEPYKVSGACRQKENESHLQPELKRYLLNRLPEYMLPAHFVILKELPKTANGKIDRKKLPQPKAEDDREAQTQFAPPRNEIDRRLVDIWSQVLGIESSKIGIEANFFELGGHSLKLTILVSKIKSEFDVSVSLTEVFKMPTIRGMSENIERQGGRVMPSVPSNLVLLRQGSGPGQNLFLVHAGSGEVDIFVEFCNHLKAGINYWGIKADRLKDFSPLNLSIKNIARQYIDRIKKVQAQGPYYIAGWCFAGTIAFEMARQLESRGEEIGFLGLINSLAPQEELGNGVNEFSLESELSWLSDYLPQEKIKEGVRNVKELDRLWPLIVQYFERDFTDTGTIRGLIPENIAMAIPNFRQLGIRELIYYLNIVRSFDRARNLYIPEGKIDTELNFFCASRSEIDNRDRWRHYCRKPVKFHHVNGDHFSIFEKPEVAEFAKKFEPTMLNRL